MAWLSGDVADDFAERYVSWFSAGTARRPEGPRSVGVELEYPVVDEHGRPSGPARVIGAAARFGAAVTTDMGSSTLEARVGPVPDLHLLDRQVTDLVSALSAGLAVDGCRLLGYGLQPAAGIEDRLLTPGERYRQLHDASVPAPGGARWGALLCLSASSQVHVDVAVAEAARVTGALNRTAALRIALLANSPWSARLPGSGQARRELFWDRGYPNRPRRWGILPPSETLGDHARALLATDAFLASRDGRVLRIEEPVSWADLLRSGRPVTAWDVDGARHQLQPRVTDPLEHLGAIWSCARLSPAYGTVEDRVACAQPPGEQVANAALVLGLVECAAELSELADTLPLSDWVEARVDACGRGLAARVGPVPVAALAARMLAIAACGLAARGLAEDRFLDPLRERLARGENPATRLLAVPAGERLPWILERAALLSADRTRARRLNIDRWHPPVYSRLWCAVMNGPPCPCGSPELKERSRAAHQSGYRCARGGWQSVSSTVQQHRYVIVGAGPAGLQLSYYLQQAGADYVTLEREAAPGHFFSRFPRHRRLISLNKVHTVSTDPEIRLRWDWNSLLNDSPELMFPKFSSEYLPAADDLVHYLGEFQRLHGLAVRYNTEVERIERAEGGGFLVRTGDGVLHGQCVIVAAGWGHPYVPPIPGIEHATGYEDMETDPAAYTDQRVLIIGKGNSAFEAATPMLGHAAMIHLASRRPLRLAWNTKHPGHVRGQFGVLLDSYQFKTLHSVLDCTIDEIRPVDGRFQVRITYTHADGEQAVLDYESVIRCTGFRMDTTIFDEAIRPEMINDGRMPALGPDWQSPTVEGLYFAGTIAQARDSGHASSPFIDGFRYNLRTFAKLLRERYDGVPLPCDAVGMADPDKLTSLVLDRLNWSSALWTQFEYLCDVLVVDEETGLVTHYQDLPEDYAVSRFRDEPHYYTAQLRWGRDEYGDVFAIGRHPEPDRASESAFIHPVIRRYHGAEMVAEKHLLEDLLAEWRREDRHIGPLRDFFTADLSTAP